MIYICICIQIRVERGLKILLGGVNTVTLLPMIQNSSQCKEVIQNMSVSIPNSVT